MWRREAAILVLAVLASMVPATAGDATPRRHDGPQGAAEVVRIRIVDNRFRGGTITVDRGTVVKWVNKGSNLHTTTSDTRLWDSGDLSSGEVFRKKFRRAGTFPYHCEIHSSMTGTITVT